MSRNYSEQEEHKIKPHALRNLRKHTAVIVHCERGHRRKVLPPFEPDGSEFDSSQSEEYRDADENAITKMFADGIEANARSLANEIFKKRWAFLCLDEPRLFTSDFPVAVKHLALGTFGIGTPGLHVFSPVSPKRMLRMTDRENQPDGFYPFPSERGAELNFFTLGNSKTLLLAQEHPDSMLKPLDDYLTEMTAQAYHHHSASVPLRQA